MILDDIIAKKREILPLIIDNYNANYQDKRKSLMPRESFYDAISKPGLSIIGEIKKASPSKGIIKENFSPILLAKEYVNHVDAISVLTEEHFFMGHLDYLKDVHEVVKLPLLCKDFIIDPVQIQMAYELGASCVLLIASILTEKELQDYILYARSLNMDALIEIHTEQELEKALKTDAKIIGINNRNLSDFKTDLNTTIRLSHQVPKDCLIISESGIHKEEDIGLISTKGRVNAVLVGESFMRASNIGIHAKELRNGYKARD